MNKVESISDMQVNQELLVTYLSINDAKPIRMRSLGDFGPTNGSKVYLCKSESSETPESMAKKFESNLMPDCVVCWDFQIGTDFEIHKFEA